MNKWKYQIRKRKKNRKIEETSNFIKKIELISEEIENSLTEIDEYEKLIKGKSKEEECDLIFNDLVSLLI